MNELYRNCTLCPRNCGADRNNGPAGFCCESSGIRVASACLHFGEEPPVTAGGGSGTIFLTGCNLRCAFCQNYQISQQRMGADLSPAEFVEICLKLQAAGAENINIVTGSHAVPALAEGIRAAKDSGLKIPVCWNSSAYEKPETLELLSGLVDIWLPDLKTLDSRLSGAVFAAADYPEQAKNAVLYMLDNAPLKLEPVSGNRNGMAYQEKMVSGVIVRHLFLPGRLEDTVGVLEWLKSHADGKAYISLMSQYTPVPFQDSPAESVRRCTALKAFENRLVSRQEFVDLQDILEAFDFQYLFYQELEQSTEWLPDFNRLQPFSNKLARPVWHWASGFID